MLLFLCACEDNFRIHYGSVVAPAPAHLNLGITSTYSGIALASGSTDGAAISAQFFFGSGAGMTFDSSGNLYVADTSNNTIRKISTANIVSTFAGTAGAPGAVDGTGIAARFDSPGGIVADSGNNLFVTDSDNNQIRKITPAGVVTTFAGSGATASVDGTGPAAQFNYPYAIAIDSANNLYVTDIGSHVIRKITPGAVVTTLAGSAGMFGSTDGTGAAARFNDPEGLAVDSSGNIFVADSGNATIRKITPAGVVTTFAGSGVNGSADGIGLAAEFDWPMGIAFDSSDNLYVSDWSGNNVRKITPAAVVSTLSGVAGNVGSTDGTGALAEYMWPCGAAVNSSNILFIGDCGNHNIRKVE